MEPGSALILGIMVVVMIARLCKISFVSTSRVSTRCKKVKDKIEIYETRGLLPKSIKLARQ